MADAILPSLYLLDMGPEKYGDCILGRFGEVTVLVDGGHRRDDRRHGDTRSVPEQLTRILGQPPPFDLSLLVVVDPVNTSADCGGTELLPDEDALRSWVSAHHVSGVTSAV